MTLGKGIGYKASKLSTIHLMDTTRLRIELGIRGLLCEIPECSGHAVTMAKSGVAQLMCQSHDDLYRSDPRSALALETSVKLWLQFCSTEIARHAYEDQDGDDSVVFAFDGSSEMLLRIRSTLSQAADPTAKPVTPRKRPVPKPISTLASANSHPALDFFMM